MNIENLNTRRNFLQASAVAMGAGALGVGHYAYGQDAGGSSNLQKDLRLEGKKAVVTGAARGIGRAIAVHLARAGADVMGIDICGSVTPVSEVTPATKKDLQETERLVRAEGRDFISVIADVRNLPLLREASARAEKTWGRVDIVVPNAGIQVFKPLAEMEDHHWHDVIDNNLNGYANTLRAFVNPMIKRNSGRFIFIASSQGRAGTKHAASYSASKWGVIGLMKSAALELGEHHITVNAVIPGLVDTALTRNPTRWREAIGEENKNPPAHPTEEQAAAASIKKYPLQVPWLQPDDIAPAVVFLASDAAKMVSGADYDVSAGFSAHYNA